jgi:dihydroorotate dehydrogenase
MSTPEITDQQIADAAAAPQSVSADGVTVTNRSMDDLRKAREELANNSNASKPRRGLLFTKMIPGSARGQ